MEFYALLDQVVALLHSRSARFRSLYAPGADYLSPSASLLMASAPRSHTWATSL